MADTFAYDLVKFLRVIYLRRWFILKGAFAACVLAAILSLVLPETWRANAGVYVSTPEYKTRLRIADRQGFDVNWYQGILTSDNLYREIIDTLRWLHQSTHRLLDTDAVNRLKENLNEKAATLTDYQLIENTNLTVLSELLLDDASADDPRAQTRIAVLGHLSDEEIEEIYHKTGSEIEDLTIHDLRRNLSSHVAVLVDTNLEKIYSKRISVSAKAGTAIDAKMLANLWLDLFQARAEQTVRAIFNKEVLLQKQRAARAEQALASAEAALSQFDREHQLNNLQAELTAKKILLYGMEEQRNISVRTDEAFDLENENLPFMTEKRLHSDQTAYTLSPQFENALLPQKVQLEKEIASFTQTQAEADVIQQKQAELQSLNRQITRLQQEIQTLTASLRDKESQRLARVRRVTQAQQQWSDIQPLLSEAVMLESDSREFRYSDASLDRAIKPDLRDFPRRSLMTVLGGLLGLILFTGLAFFEDIRQQVTRVDDEPAPEVEP